MHDTAYFVLSKKKLHEQYNTLKEYCDSISYSVKTNPLVAEILEKETDCAFSIYHHKTLTKIQDPLRIWFFAQAWNKEEIQELLKKRIINFVVDNQADLNTLKEVLKTTDKSIGLLLRMRLKEHTVHTGKHFVYGMYSTEINKEIQELKQYKAIKTVGIHFHRKTQNISEWSLKNELEQALTKETLETIKVINIGGGIPVSYNNFRADVIGNIFKELAEVRAWLKQYTIKMIIEPGRFLAAPCVELHAQVKNIYNNTIIINCSVYNAAMDTFIANIRLKVKGEQEHGTPYTIKGSTPDSMDIFRYRVFLNDVKQGDTIVFENAGAYNFSCDFCGLEKLPTKIID